MCVSYFEEIFQTFSPDDIAGIIVEGLPANSGILIPPPGYMEGLRSICDKYGIMFLVDEVYSGFGRTGKFLAVENWNVIPDIVCLGKAMGSGLPISAVAAKAEIINQCDFLGAGAQGSFSGNIASCTASIATIELIKEEGLLGKASRVGEYMKGRLDELAERYERIGDIRGIGLMIGLELVKDRYRKVPGTEEAQRVQQNALGRGLLISRVGRYGNVIRMSPHLVTTREQADTGLEILEDSLKSAIV
jgi:4-aminobutyrate aminotransferase/(S)-3-amino-2-methylpropionate transaminase